MRELETAATADCGLPPVFSEAIDNQPCVSALPTEFSVNAMFQAKLLDNMYDAVVFIDAAGRVALWNHGAERLTGIAGSSVRQRPGIPSC